MRKLRLILAFILAVALMLFAACGGKSGGTNEPENPGNTQNPGGDKPSPPEKDMTLPENYDFGAPESWVGEQIESIDLGDCIMDVYPYDERYDWGQSILYDEDDGLYKMWWCRHSKFDSIWYAESKDLKNWTSLHKVMAPEQNTTWIKLHVGKPSVLKINGKFVMYFEAPATLNNWKEFDNNVFMAASDDGIKWHVLTEREVTKNPSADNTEPYPVIRMTDEQMEDSWDYSQSGGTGYGYYGIGQPSALYVNGKYYVYCTHTFAEGDRFWLFKSDDGLDFDDGTEVFLRAGSGVKYNTLTEKFMMAYEYTQGSVSRVYYMESDDGIDFTYSNYIEAANNQNIISKGAGFVRGYPDFVHDGKGCVNSHTVYAAYMEGRMADAGNDWRQYSHTWDIHIAMFNPAEFAKRTQVLPSGRVNGESTIAPYRLAHITYENKLESITELDGKPEINGERDSVYNSAQALKVDRTVCEDYAVPGKTTAEIRASYTVEALYVIVEVKDDTKNEDYISVILDEKVQGSKAYYIEAKRDGGEVATKITELSDRNTPLTDTGIEVAVKEIDNGWNMEIKMPWIYKSSLEAYDTVGFDCYVFDNWGGGEYKSTIAWNDWKTRYNNKNLGELYFAEE